MSEFEKIGESAEHGIYRFGYLADGNSYAGTEDGLKPIVFPAKTAEEASELGPEYFDNRHPQTTAEEARFLELFGYYPNGMGA